MRWERRQLWPDRGNVLPSGKPREPWPVGGPLGGGDIRHSGACFLACQLYEQLGLDHFFSARLAASRKGTKWWQILQTLVCYRLIDPGSEWRLHRQWFEQSGMGDLLGADYGLVEIHALYRCLDKLLEHKTALFDHLNQRWRDLFGARFEVLLYALSHQVKCYLQALHSVFTLLAATRVTG